VQRRPPGDNSIAANAIPAPTGGSNPRPFLSLIVPAYNEGQRLRSSLAAMSAYLGARGFPYEIIVVDDGSSDDTAAIAAEAAARDPHLRALGYQPNRGKGCAVRTGMLAARGEYHMFIDADLSIPVEIAEELIAAIKGGHDIAIASRWHPGSSESVRPPLPRRVMGSIFRWCVHRLVVSDVRDTQCGCKAYRADVSRRLFGLSQIDRFSFDAEVMFLAARLGYRVKEVPFALRHVPGSRVRPVRDALLMLRDLLRIRLNALRGTYGRLRTTERVGQVL
jgi:dolichyl-phosphate beta-glucosyltransferase